MSGKLRSYQLTDTFVMPAPVSFNIALAPLPNNFSGTPQQLATAIADRLTIAPTAPWSSFQNGGSIPTSDVGPVLFNGTEWRVYDTGLGAYTFATQNGAGLVNNTVTLNKLIGGTAGSLLYLNTSGRPAELLASSGTNGQTLQLVSGVPAWSSPIPTVTSNLFEVTLGSNQPIDTNASNITVQFNLVRTQKNVTFDITNYQVPVTAGSVWLFYVQLQVEDTGAASTNVQFITNIRSVNNSGYVVSSLTNLATVNSRFSATATGIIPFASADFVQVIVVASETTAASGGLNISANSNSRFGGVRLV
jgi:hypothetical protein